MISGKIDFMFLSLFMAAQTSLLVPMPENILEMFQSGEAEVISATKSDIGEPLHVFDLKRETLWRTPSINPAEIAIAFKEPKRVDAFRVTVHDLCEVRIFTADSLQDLRERKNSINSFDFNPMPTTDNEGVLICPYEFKAKYFQLHVQRLQGDDYVHVYEWQFCKLEKPDGIAIERIPARPEWKPSNRVSSGGLVRVKAWLTKGDKKIPAPEHVSWSGEYFKREPQLTGNAWQAVEVSNEVKVGKIKCSFGDLKTEFPIEIHPYDKGVIRKDANVLFIEKTPHMNYDNQDKGGGLGYPSPGESVTWVAHVRSMEEGCDNLEYIWRVNDRVISKGTIPKISKNETVTTSLTRRWNPAGEALEFEIIAPDWDANPFNNKRKIRTNALSVGFWVEQRLADHWLANQHKQNYTNESFEDWANYMIELWNEMMENAVYPIISPSGLSDRFRLDRVWIVPTGALPLNGGLPSNNPDSSNKWYDIIWGFNAEEDGGVGEYWTLREHDNVYENPPAFLADWALIHELMHARYIIDSYGFDVHAPSIKINLNNKPIIGTLLPENFARFNKYKGVMGGGIRAVIDEYVAGALERVKGKRARGGNMNAPSVIGEYLNDLPENNLLRFFLPNGKPANFAEVYVYRAKPQPDTWYGKIYAGEPDATMKADENGIVNLGKNPFSEGMIVHTYGHANSVLLLLIKHDGKYYIHFQEVSDFNLAYWKGHRYIAEYEVKLAELPVVSD